MKRNVLVVTVIALLTLLCQDLYAQESRDSIKVGEKHSFIISVDRQNQLELPMGELVEKMQIVPGRRIYGINRDSLRIEIVPLKTGLLTFPYKEGTKEKKRVFIVY